jgi:hypothetical protein
VLSVLAGFVAGLALGAALAHGRVDRPIASSRVRSSVAMTVPTENTVRVARIEEADYLGRPSISYGEGQTHLVKYGPYRELAGDERKRHRVQVRPEYSDMTGIGQAVMWDRVQDVKFGASDPRGDGAAIPEPIPEASLTRVRR